MALTNGQGPPITARRLTAYLRAIHRAGLDLKTVRVDPATGALEAIINTEAASTDEADFAAVLDRRIARSEQERSATRKNARHGAKPAAGAQSDKPKLTRIK